MNLLLEKCRIEIWRNEWCEYVRQPLNSLYSLVSEVRRDSPFVVTIKNQGQLDAPPPLVLTQKLL